VLLPLALTVPAFMKERGAVTPHLLRRLAFVAAPAIVIALAIASGQVAAIDWAHARFVDAAIPTPIPQAGLFLLGAGFLVTVARAAISGSPVEHGFAGAIAASALALHFADSSAAFAVLIAAAALLIATGVLEDTFRMAFRDELTGLPSRRALNEHMQALGPRYAAAMIDVDHFKNFNDTYGHDVGDQVLRMVATQIARTSGGGRAYRYGGEEFTVLFPGKSVDEALPHLEAVRRAVANYAMALRAPGRPRTARAAKQRRTSGRPQKTVAVTVSIGVAARSERLSEPGKVLAAADKALYRAKHKGRNQVSR
jgi:GGDEF domain-containing protein